MSTKMKLALIAVHPDNPRIGDLCVWNMHDPPHTVDRYAVKDLAEAKTLIRRLTEEQLKNDSVGCNAFGLEVYANDQMDPETRDFNAEWVEWEDQDSGDDILTVMDAEDEAQAAKG